MIERNTDPHELPDWFVDLVVLRATEGLSDQDNRRFESYVAESPNRELLEKDIEKLELAAAATELAGLQSDDVMPASVRNRVLVAGGRFEPDQTNVPTGAGIPQQDLAQVDGIPHSRAIEKSQRFTRREAMGWLAAAASIAVLVTGWNPFAKAPDVPANPVAEGSPPLAPAKQMVAFLETRPSDLIDVSWAATQDAPGATGQVLWSDKAQEGYMVFQGLAANIPTQSQYQLWIFDTDPEQKYPVDGGVFDVGQGKTVVSIDPKIRVNKAVQFAVTEERPGGVVVSDRKRLPLLATL